MTTIVPGWRRPCDPEQWLQDAQQNLAACHAAMSPPEAALRRTLAAYAQALYWENLARMRGRTQGVGALLCWTVAVFCLRLGWFWPALGVVVLGIVCVGRWWTAREHAVQWRAVMEQQRQTLHEMLHEPAALDIAQQIYREMPRSTFAHLSTFLLEVLQEREATVGKQGVKEPGNTGNE